MTRVYLDYNASAPLRPEAKAAMLAALEEAGNPSSVHGEGRRARKVVEEARAALIELLGCTANGVIFTSGGTEANNLAIEGMVGGARVSRLFVSAIEHDATLECAAHAGVAVETIPVRGDGVVDLDWLRERLDGYDAGADGKFLVCLMLANNETGVIQPAGEAGDLARAHGGRIFVDACQAVGKVPVDMIALGADLLSVSAHKFGGPQGAGALLVRPEIALAPTHRGGGQELRRRAGTENVAAIAGLGAAARTVDFAGMARVAALRDAIEAGVMDEGARVWGADAPRLPTTLSLSAPGFTSETQVMAMDLAGIAVSAGAACSSGKVKPSHVLAAMGAGEEDAGCGLRVSLGWASRDEDVSAFLDAWRAAYGRVKQRAA